MSDPRALTASCDDPAMTGAQLDDRQPIGAMRLLSEHRTVYARYLGGVAALAAAYYAAAQLGYTLRFTGPVGAIVWLPVGVGIAFLYVGGLQLWPGVLIGDVLADNATNIPLAADIAQTVGNVLEVVVAVLILRYLLDRRGPQEALHDVAATALAIAAGVAVSATIGCIALHLAGVIPLRHVPASWRTWWLGDFSGGLLLVPPVVAWHRMPVRGLAPPHIREAVLVLAVVAGASALAWQQAIPLSYLVFPPLIWSALRLGLPGASVAAALASAFAVWGVVHHLGPFETHSLAAGVLHTQLFIAVATFSTLCLAAVVAERRRLGETLNVSRLHLVQAAEYEQRRLGQNLHDGAQQRLTALVVRLGLAAELTREDRQRGAALFRTARSELEQAIDELRTLAHGNHPPLLTERGLAPVIADMAARSPIPIKLGGLPSRRLPPSAEASVYYVIAEAVTNAQKHAHATTIRLAVRTRGATVIVEVADNGAGGAAETPGSGLRGLRERVEAVGGTFAVDSPAGRGTHIIAAIPILPPGR
ncbi:MAG: MASE1 domain-containing protein [Solirubrobacteraceae bacterium]